MKRWAAAVILLPMLAAGCAPTTPTSSTVTGAATTPQSPPKLDGQQQYTSAQQIADDLTVRGHRCDMSHDSGGMYVIDGGRCYLGGSAGPEVVLSVYTSQSQIDNYFAFITPKMDTYAWLVGNKWTIDCESSALCSDLQAVMGGSIHASVNQPPQATPTTTAAPATTTADDKDQEFLLAVQGHDDGMTDAQAIRAGRSVCPVLRGGSSPTQAAMNLSDNTPGMSLDDAAFMVGAAVAAWCPEFRSQLDQHP